MNIPHLTDEMFPYTKTVELQVKITFPNPIKGSDWTEKQYKEAAQTLIDQHINCTRRWNFGDGLVGDISFQGYLR